MKKLFQRRLIEIVFIVMSISLLLNYYSEIKIAQRQAVIESNNFFWQVDKNLRNSQIDVQNIKEEFAYSAIIRAKLAAYVVQQNPDLLNNSYELQKIASMLWVDELSFIDSNGTLFVSTIPSRINTSLYTDEQISFLQPMLINKNLELTQDFITSDLDIPRDKLMIYSAVWDENKNRIAEIGINPIRLEGAVKKNHISHIFSLLAPRKGIILYAMDTNTNTIVASNKTETIGKNISDIGLDLQKILNNSEGFHAYQNEELTFTVSSGDKFKDKNIAFIRLYNTGTLYGNANKNTLFLAIYMLLVSAIIIFFITRYLEQSIIHGISTTNETLAKITKGDLDTQVNVQTTPEFTELSTHINTMVTSLLHTTDKLSFVLNSINIPIAVYEYSSSMNRVRTTNKMAEILSLSKEEMDSILSNHQLFQEKLKELKQYPYSTKESIYCLPGPENRYIKMESFIQDNTILGILIDVTQDVLEKQRLRHQRDNDLLTGLYNRRAFYNVMDKLFEQPKKLQKAALFMLDADNLKYINDTYGHDFGDHYIRCIGKLLSSINAPHKVISRLGGDEFVLFVYGCSDTQTLMKCRDELHQKCGFTCNEAAVPLTIQYSIGYAIYPTDANNYHILMKYADERMYEEKRQRRKKNIIKDR